MMGNQNTIEEYAKYIKKKIITLGIKVKKIKFLQFYEQDPLQIQTLSELANQNGNSAYILESRFLLGKYYQNEAVKQTK